MKIGIRNGSLRTTHIETIPVAASLGYDGVELDIGADYAETALWQPDGRKKLLALAEKHDCEVASLCVGALWQLSPANPDAEVRAEANQVIIRSAAIAAELGARWILLPVSPGGEGVDHEECVRRWVEEIAKVAAAAADNDIYFCLENVGRGCGKSAGDLMRLIDGIGSPHVGAYYDIGNAIAFENNPTDEIRQLGDAMHIVHVKDHSDRLGTGDVPIAECMQVLQEAGYDDYLVLETSPTDAPREAGSFNLGFLRGMLAEM